MLQWWNRFSARPWVAHIMRAVERFTVRGGSQLAAATAYFSVLALVPILMLGFSLLGVVLTMVYPDALRQLEDAISAVLPEDSPLAENLYQTIDNALTNWAGTTLVSVFIIIWVGSSWIGNQKRAVRLLMREQVDDPGSTLPLPLDLLANFAGLIGLLVGIAVTFAASLTATSLGTVVGDLLGLATSPGWSLVLRVVSGLVSFGAGMLLFRLLFAWFSPRPVRNRLAWLGAGVGSAGLLILQFLTGYLISAFSRNLGTGLFGSTIVVMLFLNLFATLILFIATWLATAEVPASEPAVAPEPVADAVLVESRPGQHYVSARVAERSMGVGLRTGCVVGTATGLGIGAVLFGWLRRRFGGRR